VNRTPSVSPRVRESSRFAVFLRGLVVQAGFNYRGFQNLGWAAMLLPALRDLESDPERRDEALQRQLGYFNTHPYLAGVVAGAMIRDEERRAAGDPRALDEDSRERLQRSLASLLGNIGDRLIWAGLMPLAILAGLLTVFFEPLWGALVLLLLYNLPLMVVRSEGLRLGYDKGPEVFREVGGRRAERLVRWTRRVAALAAGALFALLVLHPRTPAGWPGVGLVGVATAVAVLLWRRRIPPVLAWLVVTLLVSLYALLI
jgi:mannose/fructose/N-acetylgalactosamine-specific phosphotransferase system component IID